MRRLVDKIIVNEPSLAGDIIRDLEDNHHANYYEVDIEEAKNEYGVVTQVRLSVYATNYN